MESNGFWLYYLVAALALTSTASSLALAILSWRRCALLKREMGQISDGVSQMATLQLDLYRKVTRNIHDVEDRVLDLSAPSGDSSLPLERRHRVMRLSGKGLSVQEISDRLKVPSCEVELILNLRKFADVNGGKPKPAGPRPPDREGPAWKGAGSEMLA